MHRHKGKGIMVEAEIPSSVAPICTEEPDDLVSYPHPLATYDQVLTSGVLFKTTLQKFHAGMGTKYMNPVIGGKSLDLHRLFAMVTSRGGFCKVYEEKKWKEVHDFFEFKRTATNSGYLVRKHYFSLLLHYERVYFQGIDSWSPTQLEALRVRSFPNKYRQRTGAAPSARKPAKKRPAISEPEASSRKAAGASSSSREAAKKKPATSAPEVPAGLVQIPPPTIMATIESKFDVGYYITSKIGDQALHGILYHIAPAQPQPQPQPAASGSAASASRQAQPQQPAVVTVSTSTAAAAAQPEPPSQQLVVAASTSSAAAGTEQKGGKKAGKKVSQKKGRTGYNTFFSEELARLRAIYGPKLQGGNFSLSPEISATWRSLSIEAKEVYKEMARVYNMMREQEQEQDQLRLAQATGEPEPLDLLAAEAVAELSLGQSFPVQPAAEDSGSDMDTSD